MAKLGRANAVDWTILAAALSLVGTACSSGGGTGSNDTAVSAPTTETITSNSSATSSGPTTIPTPTPTVVGPVGTPTVSPVAATPGATATGGTAGATATNGPALTTPGPVDPPVAAGGSTPGATGPAAGGSANGAGGATGGAGGGVGPGSDMPNSDGWNYNPEFKEFTGEDCDLPEPALLSSPSHQLPDPFLMADGSRMSSKEQWACQRAWLRKNLEKFVHGTKPGRPEVVTGSVSSTAVNVHVENGGSSADFMVPIDLPSDASLPVPAMFQADGSGVPTSFLEGEGVAAIRYSHDSAESAFNKLYGGSGVADPIKWAWAVSRVIDVLVDEAAAGGNDIVDPHALATTGCSYAGKSAFIVGAYDERIALGIPQESGTGGLGSYRVVADSDRGPNQGEDPEQVNEACSQGWLTSNVCNGNVDSIPADAHFLVAMYAPRGFTTLDNNRIGHLGPVAQFASAAAGAEVFKALGVESHVGYHGGNDTDPHNHCSFYASQEETTRKAIEGFLTKKAEPANFMEPKLKDGSDQPVNFDLANYISWDTPTIE